MSPEEILSQDHTVPEGDYVIDVVPIGSMDPHEDRCVFEDYLDLYCPLCQYYGDECQCGEMGPPYDAATATGMYDDF